MILISFKKALIIAILVVTIVKGVTIYNKQVDHVQNVSELLSKFIHNMMRCIALSVVSIYVPAVVRI